MPFTRLEDVRLKKYPRENSVNVPSQTSIAQSYVAFPPRACRSATFTIANESMNSTVDTSLGAPASFWVNLKMNTISTGMSGSPS